MAVFVFVHDIEDTANWPVDVFVQVKSRLGGRIRLIVSGGAPLSSEVEEFLRVTSCAFVLQGYGKLYFSKYRD